MYVKVSEIFQRIDEKGRRVKSGGRIPRELRCYRPRLDEIWDTFGPDRLPFASDWTNREPIGTFGETLGLVHEYFAKGSGSRRKILLEEFTRGILVDEMAGKSAQLGINRQRTVLMTTELES